MDPFSPTPDPDYTSPANGAGRPSGPNPPRLYPGAARPGERPFPPGPRVPPPGPNPPPWQYALVGVLLAAVFFLGVFLDRTGWLPGAAGREPPGVAKTFAPFWETWDLVHENYVDQPSVDNNKMTQFAIEGMLDALGDVGHTTYLSPEDVKRENDALHGHMEGIGAIISIRDKVPTILLTMPDSPARKAGLKPGDILLKVDDKPITQDSLQQVVDHVRGPAGKEVTLTVHRGEDPKPIEIKIVRGKVEVPDVTWHMLPGEPYAHIALRSFGEHADDQLRAALKAAREQGAKGVVFDLRANPGGYKDQAVKVSSEFLKSGDKQDVFIEQDMHGDRTPVPVEPGGTALDVPMVVLIDGGTASAAEICGGALQDHKRAELVGEKTFGTGTVLVPFKLSNGGEVLLATLEWLTPDGRKIWHDGIKPDVEVALKDPSALLLPEMEDDLTPEAFQKSGDAQLLKAIEILRGQK